METQSVSKTTKLILMISLILNIILIITVVMQYRHITENMKAFKEVTFTETSIKDNKSGSKTGHTSSKITGSVDSNSDKEKIKNLESQIADMQDWQEYLEETIKKDNNEKAEREERSNKTLKANLTSQMEVFAEEYSIPVNIKTKLIELLIERELAIREVSTGSKNVADIRQEKESIKSQYENMISEFLSEEDYNAYKEYLDSEQDRTLVKTAKDHPISGDIQLNKQQERNLVSAIYRKRLEIEEAEDLIRLRENENLQKKEGFKKMLRAEEKLLDGYIEEAKDILSESQIEKFQNFIEVRRSILKMTEKQIDMMSENENSSDQKDNE